VAANDEVDRHQVIALSGNTGTSTAPHLHFEVWQNGEPIDPRELVAPPNP
jgi:murein DD-endopeptidase MepM/ murein hydrolase activator NlpD